MVPDRAQSCQAEGILRQQLKRVENRPHRADSRLTMKSQLIAAVLVVGCGESQQSAPAPEAKPIEPVAEAAQPEPPTAKAPDISIHKAAEDGNIEAVKQHLAAGADVNANDFVGATALHNAVRVKVGETTAANKDVAAQKEIIELLIAAGADVNARGEHYPHLTPLNYALFPDQPEIYDLLLKHGGKTGDWFEAEESIHIAARVGHVEAIKKHLADGVDVNAKDKDNIFTALDAAITRSHTEAADLLRKHGGKTKKELEAEGK